MKTPHQNVGGQGALQSRIQALGATVRARLCSVMELTDDVIEPILVALLAQGHVLIEGVPGTGKTLLARTLARTVGLVFKRIQFTNDLMPSDIVGSSVWRPGTEEFVFVRGPLFANVVLADEINRTSPRTLSCLLEAMESGVLSVEGEPVEVSTPFFVLATRNPIEFHGTYPVPEAALDRFLVRVTMEYPDREAELRLYRGRDPEALLEELEPATTREELLELRSSVDAVRVSDAVAAYCHGVASATRTDERVALGASPRAAMTWLRAARARACLEGRAYVLPDDLKALARSSLAHRVVLQGGGDAAEVIADIVSSVAVDL